MKTDTILLCPFDKEACIRETCAVWSVDRSLCGFSLIPEIVEKLNKPVPPLVNRQAKSESDGGSGKYRTLLFD